MTGSAMAATGRIYLKNVMVLDNVSKHGVLKIALLNANTDHAKYVFIKHTNKT